MKKTTLTKKEQKVLEIMNMSSLEEVLFHYPSRYDEITRTPYRDWVVGQKVTFEARLISVPQTNRFNKITMTRFTVMNEDDTFQITIFNRPWMNRLQLNSMLTIFGKYEGSQRVVAIKYNMKPLSEQLGFRPVYALKKNVEQGTFSSLVKKAMIQNDPIDLIPQNYRVKYRLISRKEALYNIHFPSGKKDLQEALRHLKYEEFLKFQVIIALRRRQNFTFDEVYQKSFDADEVFRMANCLPFALTNDQLRAVQEIISDLAAPRPMYRLIQGDVGCGKTIVAALGIYAACLSGFQAAFMAPTEILAKQQARDIARLFKVSPFRVACLYSSLNATEKKEILSGLEEGTIDAIVGTHALIQDQVAFKRLGLVVTDEQHRFGVNQRRLLAKKGEYVDFLVMSATPIPRTLSNVLYGDMDVSIIKTQPVGRKPVVTRLIRQNSMSAILPDIRSLIGNGSQCYVICPAIDEDNDLNVRNTTSIYQALKNELKDEYQIGMLHGRMESMEKDEVMRRFRNGEIQFLVSTTVIEVGVNVKRANVMVIYDANRFGLSQLHQLRGRVKRSSRQGYCFLLTDSKDDNAIARLKVLESSEDGFRIAEEDLLLRGPGDILGTRQSGLPPFILGDIVHDQNILRVAMADALEILDHPNPDNQAIRQFAGRYINDDAHVD